MIRFYPICRGAEVQGEDLLLQIFTSSILQRQAGEEAPFLEFIQRLGALQKGWFSAIFGKGKTRVGWWLGITLPNILI